MADDNAPPDKLSVIVHAGFYDKVLYALVMASGAAAIGRPATLFFTMGACRALMADDGDGPAWRSMALSDGPGTGGGKDDGLKEKNLASFETLLEACIEMDVKFMVCEMGLKAEGLTRDQLRADIPFEEGGVVTFLNDASRSGAVVFI